MFSPLALILAWGFLGQAQTREKPDNLTTHGLRPSAIELEPCQNPGSDEWGLCGTYDVYEDRETMKGRTIAMRIVVYPAKGDNPSPDPLFVFLGGPGQGAASFAGFMLSNREKIRERRDLVFIDQRGTGASNPLTCQIPGPKKSLQTYLKEMFPLNYVKTCREALAQRADLTKYTTDLAMDDIDEIRAALGYDQINISGGSYGTRACMVYMRRHPQTVRTAILKGLAPPHMAMPATFAEDMEDALQRLINDCQEDTVCHKAFPNFGEHLTALLEKLQQGPIETEVMNPLTKETEKVSLSLGPFLTIVRAMLYSARRSAELPLTIEQASQGNFQRLVVNAAMYTKNINEGLAEGMYLSITCAEDIPFIDFAASEHRAKGTFLGDYRLFQQRRACEHWPRAKIPPNFVEPITSNIPTLLFSGEVDPVTPPRWGAGVAKGLSNSLHVSIPNAAHGMGSANRHGMSDLEQEFLDKASVEDLDPSPLKAVKRPPFLTEDKNL